MESNERLMTVGEVAEWLSMSTPWVYKAVERGDLPFCRIGNAVRFDKAAIEEYLASRKNLNISKLDKSKN